MSTDAWDYDRLRKLSEEEPPPFMVVDLDVLDRNVDRLVRVARSEGKPIRVASKSVRVPSLLEYVRSRCGKTFGGLMTYSPAETVFLHERGFEDFLVAYPRVHEENLRSLIELNRSDADLRLMVDEPAHLRAIENAFDSVGGRGEPLPVCIDLDVSYRPGNLTHLGVLRSPVRTLEDFESLYRSVKENEHVTFAGVMGYEAQIAGVPDASPYHRAKNYPIRLVKRLSRPAVRRKRREVADFLDAEGETDAIVNGGGTGSIRFTAGDESVTEVTAGSGFLQSHLFDYYRENENEPAFCFALPVTRRPEPGTITCQSGGFIASGSTAEDKAPRPFRPEDLSPTSDEGYGEVQSPFTVPEELDLEVGDPVFFRPAKAGEIAERFEEYLLVRGDQVVERARTYRGHGECFH